MYPYLVRAILSYFLCLYRPLLATIGPMGNGYILYS